MTTNLAQKISRAPVSLRRIANAVGNGAYFYAGGNFDARL
jgi:hypothetical protein